MDNKLNDLTTSLNENLDITELSEKKVKISELGDKNTKDLGIDKDENIYVKGSEKFKISKNNTKKFDSFYSSEKIEEIDLVNPQKNASFYYKQLKNFFRKYFLKFYLSFKNNNKHGRQGEITQKQQNNPLVNGFGYFKKQHKRIFIILFFVIFLCFVLIGTKIIVENCITSGYGNILALKNDFQNLEKAKENIRKARIKFFVANIFTTPLSIIPNNNIKNVSSLVAGGNELAKFLLESIKLYDKVSLYLNEKGGFENIYFTDFLQEIRENYDKLYSLIYSSLANLLKIGDLGDESLNAKLKFVNEKLKYFLVILDTIQNNYDTLLSILGHSSEKKYLIVFQNNDEIRPTGGFMGSTAMITLKNGKIINIENNDIYAYEWEVNKVYTDKDLAPEGLNKITGTFGLRDANYYPEFKDSSITIKSFFNKINYKLDGIIYINQNIALDLLDKVDGVDFKLLNEKITSDNFSLVLSTLVEAKIFKVGTLGTPKQVLFDFGNELYEKLMAEKNFYDYANILLKHIQNRDIVFYSFNTEENSLLWKLGLNGEVNFSEKLDFNYPVYTSIGGNKTDRYIQYRYDKFVEQLPGTCDFKTSLIVYKAHHFSKYEEERVSNLLDDYGVKNKRDILNIQGKGDNKSYVRILIPKNTIVQTAKNQNVYDYGNYKILELYITTQNLETSKTTISYTISNPDCQKYTYKFFKQPGIRKYNINFNVFGEENKYNEIENDFIYKRDEQ